MMALLHLAFFQELAQVKDGSADWRAISAGLVTLRLFDRWASGIGVEPSMLPVRSAIMAMDARDAAQRILLGLVDAAGRPGSPSAGVIARLMAYAQELEQAGRWSLAADVFRTVAQNLRIEDDAHSAIAARVGEARCQRLLGALRDAERLYKEARETAITVGDRGMELRAGLGVAMVAADRGSLPKAEKQFSRLTKEAEKFGDRELLAMALHGAGVVAHRRANFGDAVRYHHSALKYADDRRVFENVVGNLATALVEIGAYEQAGRAFSTLEEQPADQWLRWQAQVNLLELAVLRRSQTSFEQYRRKLSARLDELPAMMKAHFELYTAFGHQVFGDFGQAAAALDRARAAATGAGLHQIEFEIEDRARKVQSAERAKRAEQWVEAEILSEIDALLSAPAPH